MELTVVTRLPIEFSKAFSGSTCSIEYLVVPEFVVGPENAESVNFLWDMDLHKGIDNSPIVLHGPAKAGKSILASMIAARMTRGADTKSSNCWVAGSEFCKQFAHATLTDNLAAFRKRFRESHCMVLDDLDHVARSEGAQRELVRLLDIKQTHGTILIATASCVPATLRGLTSGIVSRLMGGLTLEIRLPGIEARRELLRLMCNQMGMPLSAREREYLISSLPPASTAEDIRTALTVLSRQHRDKASSKNKTPKFEEWIAHQHERNVIDIHDIAKSVGKQLSVSLADIKGSKRKANIVRARGLAIYLARNLCGLSLQEIGEYFGGRDHTTILHAYRKTDQGIMNDPELARIAHELQLRWRDRKNA